MKIIATKEAFLQAIHSIRANTLRSSLAALGVVIGITFVILMGWVLSGLDKAMEDSFKAMGTDVMYVDKFDWAGGKSWKELRNRPNITLDQAEKLISRLTSAELAVPVARTNRGKIVYGNQVYENIAIQGTTSQFSLTPSGTIDSGRFFNDIEDRMASNVVVLGWKVYQTLFPNGNSIGSTIKINNVKYTVIGVATKQGTTFADFMDNIVYIPLKSFLGTFGKYRRNFSICVKAGSTDQLDNVRAEVEGQMRMIRNLKPWEENNFSINETKTFETAVSTIRTIVWVVGIGMTLLSFIVGIIGIVNIMFVSIYERTKEIGIRKALGAKRYDILIQIIFESTTIAIIGAFISFVLTSVIAYITATFLPKLIPQVGFLSPTIPLDLLGIATVISIIVGIIAGLLPAMRAANFEPVVAIRYE
ncbi:MAG: ABC transporter permease [Chloroherpetonaceae bacterium]